MNEGGGERYQVYVGLRHWHPFIKETYAELLGDAPEHIIGLCLAPQQSSLSTGAYQKKVEEARAALQSTCPVSYVGSWHRHPGLIAAIVENIHRALSKFPPDVQATVPILFTAHSLPERILVAKDPYPNEVRGTVEAVTALLGGRPRIRRPTERAANALLRSGSRPSWLSAATSTSGLKPIAPVKNTRSSARRNDACWCGSGKKYKHCHLRQDER